MLNVYIKLISLLTTTRVSYIFVFYTYKSILSEESQFLKTNRDIVYSQRRDKQVRSAIECTVNSPIAFEMEEPNIHFRYNTEYGACEHYELD
jgi:hypothetical protein